MTIVDRRTCLTSAAGLFLAPAVALGQPSTARPRSRIETVLGAVDTSALGITLMHEHVLVDFIGAAEVSPARYDRDEAFKVILPFLKDVHARGCRTLVECTPAYLGRDPLLLRRLAEASALNLLTNTGYYGALNDKFLPTHVFADSFEVIGRQWIREAERGIGDTGIKPAFMKISVDAGPLSEVDTKLVRAAALTHRETGLRIHSHTPDQPAGQAQLDLLEKERVSANAFVWVHAQNVKDPAALVTAAERGAWIELDGIGPASVDRHANLVSELMRRGHLPRALISQDAGWFRVGEPGGAPEKFRGFDLLLTTFVPALESRGFTRDQIDMLLVQNPQRVLSGGE
jgi:predicted metal-dependent phosphotriesterase family hydrolase